MNCAINFKQFEKKEIWKSFISDKKIRLKPKDWNWTFVSQPEAASDVSLFRFKLIAPIADLIGPVIKIGRINKADKKYQNQQLRLFLLAFRRNYEFRRGNQKDLWQFKYF